MFLGYLNASFIFYVGSLFFMVFFYAVFSVLAIVFLIISICM